MQMNTLTERLCQVNELQRVDTTYLCYIKLSGQQARQHTTASSTRCAARGSKVCSRSKVVRPTGDAITGQEQQVEVRMKRCRQGYRVSIAGRYSSAGNI